MKMKVRIILTILTIAAFLVLPVIAYASSPSVFTGHWQAIDEDGSDIRLTIGGPPQGPFRITWTESYFSACGGEAGIIRGHGWLVEREKLAAELTLECFTTGDIWEFETTWIYDTGTDTISSDFITWHRPSARSQACVLPPSGLSGWWPGDGDARDIVSGRNGVFQDDATTGSGLVDLAFKLDGENDFIDVPDSTGLNFGSGDFTVDLWVNFNDPSGEQVLVEKWIQGEDYIDGWTLTKLFIEDEEYEYHVLRLAIDSGDGFEADIDSPPLTILPNIWYHFAATRRGSAVSIFMNGALLTEEPNMGASNLNTPASLKFGHRGNPFDTPGSIDDRGFYLNGRIDEVEIYIGTALSEEQIQALFAVGSAGKCKDAIPTKLDLRVNYGHDWVEAFYDAGHTVWITVTESDGVTVKATTELVTEPREDWGGDTGFHTEDDDWKNGPPDIQPFDWVYGWVDNGATAQVKLGNIIGEIDPDDASIRGTIYAPWFFEEEVWIECHLWISPEPEMKYDQIRLNGEDEYYCSWSGEYEFQTGWDIGPSYFGPDGHWVANVIVVP